MNGERDEEMFLLIQADVDGELNPADAARAAAHVAHAPEAAAAQRDLIALSAALKAVPRPEAPGHLKALVLAQVAKEADRAAEANAASSQAKARATWSFASWRDLLTIPAFPAFGGGFAAAACLGLLMLIPGGGSQNGPVEALVSAHIRALQPGHLMDVVSTDQHTVKPWFDGRLPFAPPVKELKPVGFPLAGGRLDYVAGHLAAALVYRRAAHEINLFVWPDAKAIEPAHGSQDGYNYERWSANGMTFWAVSDVNSTDLAEFARKWRAM